MRSSAQWIALFILLLVNYPITTDAFSPSTCRRSKQSIIRTSGCDHNIRLYSSNADDSGGSTKKKKGDSLRSTTGIRPSLHPTTINCIAEALLLRSQCVLGE